MDAESKCAGVPATRKTVCLVTRGCAKNEVDSALMEDRLLAAGFNVSDTLPSADAVIVNTCCFIQEATEESIDTIFSLLDEIEESNRDVPLVIAGCMPARYKDALSSELVEAAAFLPCKDEGNVVDVLNSVCAFCDNRAYGDEGNPLFRSVENCGASRYIKISDGCDRFCSFCAIPFIRGEYHSFTLDEISQRVSQEIATGAREIVFIAQDTGRWGEDLSPVSNLSLLLDYFATRYPSTWFRIMYTEPSGVTDELIRTIASHDNVCNYFDIPLQHADSDVLRSMNRSGNSDDFLALVSRIRSKIPDAVLRTTLIAGFPGETDQQFENLLDFLEEAEFDYVGVFPYSAEEGTLAATLPEQVEEQTKIERAQSIRDLCDSISSARIAARIGCAADVLIEGVEEDGQLFGRTKGQAPDVDGVTYVDCGEIGSIVRVIIDGTLLYEMEGSVLKNAGN